MSYNQHTPEGRDPQLWQLAQARASFRTHFYTYLAVSALLWGLWFFSGGRSYNRGFPWPVWPMFGWGIGILFHYLGAFVFPRSNAVENEYEKLVQTRKK